MSKFFQSIEDIKLANKNRGYHFFDASTMRFFHSRIGNAVYGGRFFITSEQQEYNTPRLYTIRECSESGDINTVGTFQEYESSIQAKRAILKMLQEQE